MSFVSTPDVPQGAYYTVGWLMSTVVERELGRRRLIESLCDPEMFLRDYDRAARRQTGARAASLPSWSRRFLDRFPAKRPGGSG